MHLCCSFLSKKSHNIPILVCKFFGPKIRWRTFFDKSQVCTGTYLKMLLQMFSSSPLALVSESRTSPIKDINHHSNAFNALCTKWDVGEMVARGLILQNTHFFIHIAQIFEVCFRSPLNDTAFFSTTPSTPHIIMT